MRALKQRVGWRRKKSASLVFPKHQTTDDAGRTLLRHHIAKLVLPILARGRRITIQPRFRFPNTPKGRKQLDALKTTLAEGGRVTIGREHIERWRMSPWWERAFGRQIPETITLTSPASPMVVEGELRAVSDTRTESLRLVLHGSQNHAGVITFRTPTNPLQLRLALSVGPLSDGPGNVEHGGDPSATMKLELSVAHPAPLVRDALAVARFLAAWKGGGLLQLVLGDSDPIQLPDAAPEGTWSLAQLHYWEELLNKLSFIESRISRFGRFDLTQLSKEALPRVEKLYEIMKTGAFRTRASLRATLSAPLKSAPTRPRPNDGPTELRIPTPTRETLLGVNIMLGPPRIEFLEPSAFFDAMADAHRTQRRVISVQNVDTIHHFDDWAPGQAVRRQLAPTSFEEREARPEAAPATSKGARSKANPRSVRTRK
jgi:hypothetical protein